MKKIIGFLTAAVLALSVILPSAYAAQPPAVHVAVDNEVVLFPDAQPFVDAGGNVLVPLFFTGQMLGASVKWNEKDNSVTIEYSSDTILITMPLNSDIATSVTLNNEIVSTDTAPFIKDDRTYVSLKFLSDLMHCGTSWDGRTHTAFVTSPGYTGISSASDNQDVTTSEVLNIESFDGCTLTGKLDLPAGVSDVSTLVIFVPGTGPNTFDNHRLIGDIEFNYYDLFAQELGSRQLAFLRYNTRGVSSGDEPPMYNTVDMEQYKTYTPENQARDIEIMITELKKNERLRDAKVVLLGWSEGTIIAPLVAERGNADISALMLAGYCNDTMMDIIEWQLSGESSMIFYCRYFDSDMDGAISNAEFDADPYGVSVALEGEKFVQLDVDENGILTSEDFGLLLAERKKQVLDAISQRDGEWIWNNYFEVTMEWLDGHAQLEANKDRLLKLDIPVNIFHGVYDQNVPLQGVYDIYDLCREYGKTNLKAFVFDQHDHDLNYFLYPYNDVISEGLTRIFDECAKVK